jgi:small-conductance mechanosensitive channel
VLQLFLLLPKAAIWVTVAHQVSERFPVLRWARGEVVRLLAMSASTPVFTMHDRTYSVADLIGLPLAVGVAWFAVGWIAHNFKRHVLASAGVKEGAQEVVALLARFALLAVIVVILLQAWGLDLSSLAIVASVLGVGIGFGLQNIANNFVSGIILSFERPVQPGDFIKVGEWTGTVTRVGPRSTEILTQDRVSILVPNSRFLEAEVVSWSHGDPVSRHHLPISVAYGSDVGRVRAALLEAARSHPDVLTDPRPEVELHAFGESSLDFELLVWIRVPRLQERIKSDLNFRVARAFRRHGIAIPFPQRDLHLRSPELEQLLRAYGQRNFPEIDLGGNGKSEEVEASTSSPPDELEIDGLGPRGWDEGRIAALVKRMAGGEGVPVRDRRHLFSTYPLCFVGREAVDWLVGDTGLSRAEAVELGRILVDRGVIHHVLDEHSFADDNLFYRFRRDDPAPNEHPA